MDPRSFYRRFLLIPSVFIPLFSAYSMYVLWKISTSADQATVLILHALPVCIAIIVLLIIAIVQVCKRKPFWKYVQLILIAGTFVFAFVHYPWRTMALHLNLYLYQDEREALVERLHSDTLTGYEKSIMDSVDKHRNLPVQMFLKGDEEILQNIRWTDPQGTVSLIMVQRNCEGELTVQFVYSQPLGGGDYSILYTDVQPQKHRAATWNGLYYIDTYGTAAIDGYDVKENISSHWYYVKQKERSMFQGLFDFNIFGGGFSGGGGTTGGCQ